MEDGGTGDEEDDDTKRGVDSEAPNEETMMCFRQALADWCVFCCCCFVAIVT